MPADYSVYGMFKPADLGGAIEEGIRLGTSLSDLARQRKTKKAIASAVNPDGTFNPGGLKAVAELDPEKAMAIRGMMSEQSAREQKAKQEQIARSLPAVGSAMESLAKMPVEARAAAYPQVRAGLIKAGHINPADSPEQYDDNDFNQQFAELQSTKEWQEIKKLQAETAKASADANRKPGDDPFTKSVKLMDYKDQREKAKRDEEMRRYSQVGGWQLSEGATPTQDDAKKFKAGVSAARTLLENLNEYQTLLANKGSEYGGKAAQRMESLARDIQLSAKNEDLYGLGVLTGPDLELLESLIQSPTGLSDQIGWWQGDRARNKAQQFREMINTRIDSKAKTYGFEPSSEWSTLASGGAKKGTAPEKDPNSAYANEPKSSMKVEAPKKDVRVVNGVTYYKVKGGWEAGE